MTQGLLARRQGWRLSALARNESNQLHVLHAVSQHNCNLFVDVYLYGYVPIKSNSCLYVQLISLAATY